MLKTINRFSRIKILPLLDRCAISHQRHGCVISHAYCSFGEDMPRFQDYCGKPGECAIVFSGRHVLKSFRLSLPDRLFGCRLDQHHGLLGGWGELVNTLTANRLGIPSPRLLGSWMNIVSGQLVLATENLVACTNLAEELGREHTEAELHRLFGSAFTLLTEALAHGLYHVDPNASNIMLDKDARNWFLIDFEQALPLGCKPETAFSLQAAALFDWRIQPRLDRNKYREWVVDHLKNEFGNLDFAKSLALFDEYTATRPNRSARQKRLLIASGGKPDIRPLLFSTGSNLT